MASTLQPMDKMVKARTGLILDHPFFGFIALKMKLVEDLNHATAYTNGSVIGFNPRFITGLSIDECKGLIAHEVMHVACLHHTRRGERNRMKWNIAGDLTINPILVDAGFKLPEGGAMDKSFTGHYTEQVYNLLPDNDGEDNGNWGEVQDAVNPDGNRPTQNEVKQIEQQVKQDLASATAFSKGIGKMPESLQRLVESMTASRTNYRDLLREFVEQTVANDYSWKRPNRNYIQKGIYIPTLCDGQSLGKIMIGIDTSGSVNQVELAQFTGDINEILEIFNVEIDVLYVDAAFQRRETFSRENCPVALNAKGGGGTDFRPFFEEVEKEDEPPLCALYFTDMQCYSYPEIPPEYPVLWMNTSNGSLANPPFGEVIYLEPDLEAA